MNLTAAWDLPDLRRDRYRRAGCHRQGSRAAHEDDRAWHGDEREPDTFRTDRRIRRDVARWARFRGAGG